MAAKTTKKKAETEAEVETPAEAEAPEKEAPESAEAEAAEAPLIDSHTGLPYDESAESHGPVYVDGVEKIPASDAEPVAAESGDGDEP